MTNDAFNWRISSRVEREEVEEGGEGTREMGINTTSYLHENGVPKENKRTNQRERGGKRELLGERECVR